MQLKLLIFCVVTFAVTLMLCALELVEILPYMYFTLLPISWFCWLVLILTFRVEKDLTYIISAWLFCLMALLALLKASSLFDPNLASARGNDIVMAISNSPAIFPFGISIKSLLGSMIGEGILSINQYNLPDYQKLWMEIVCMSSLQGASLFLIRFAFNRFYSKSS